MKEGDVSEGESTDAGFVAERYEALRAAVGQIVIGQDEALRQIFVTLLVGWT